jgi:ferredoxin
MARKPYVDKSTCISCEMCVNMVPGVFRMAEDGFAEVFDPAGASEGEIQDAIDNCPVNCIHWEE